ncbi:formate dehydrogenase [Polynucleobacter sp. MG-27-Goln-C1]|uniref:formate dehydrogenase n=1 Tax=Polynucleobacter sp. MG-27-Goln-C1 TaxID=1819726 RepID=UPI001C0D85E1|nr:formate dehydrogenase [Polynucleobacter sp. MG-27-Goln-C1]MBU3611520.1 formate dehydrogenase [Polynucleobacter sp. MG-27-Goln-C1]
MNAKTNTVVAEENKPSRRKFFIGAGATVGAVAVASQTPLGKAVIQEIGSTVQGKDDGYQLSAHIRKYYETTML